MGRFGGSILINRPATEVFIFLAIPENEPKWRDGLQEARKTSIGPMGVGAALQYVVTFLGRRITSDVTVIEYEPNRKYTVESISGPIPFKGQYSLEASEGGTRVTFVGESNPGGFFRLAESFITSTRQKQLESELRTLKAQIEAAG
jgi:carbon monoxide dehydrogenase subunit G